MKKLTKQKIKKTIVAIGLWSVFWFGAQGMYVLPFSPLNNLNLNLSPDLSFLFYTLWILSVAGIGLILWKKTINDFSFLKVKNKKVLFLYIVPIIIAIVLLIRGNGFNDINRPLYVAAIASSTFIAQDMLTFGFLQTYLEKILSKNVAAIITFVTFFTAHLAFQWSMGALIVLLGAIVFSYLRYRTKNIYLLDIIHISFLLLPL